MIDKLDITDEYSYFYRRSVNISLRKFWKNNVLWFYLFDQGVPNETKGTITLKSLFFLNVTKAL